MILQLMQMVLTEARTFIAVIVYVSPPRLLQGVSERSIEE